MLSSRTGLPRAGHLALCILKAQEDTKKGMYQLLHAIYIAVAALVRLSASYKRETTSKRILRAQPINYRYRACTVRRGFAL